MICMHEDERTGGICRKRAVTGTDYCTQHLGLYPCPFEVRRAVKNASDPLRSKSTLLCGLMREQGSNFCPKHALIMREMPAEMGRRKAAAKLKRDAKRAEEEFIEHSPLRTQ